MCGIAGAVSTSPLTGEALDTFKDILKRIRHRGYSLYETGSVDTQCVLGTNRLEIVDIERGVQPFVSRDKTSMLVFNGEIYNYKELAEVLKEVGADFLTSCDTEVILEGYRISGVDWLCESLQGMFAFIIYDSNKQELIAIRDPFGIKPLYWTEAGGVTFFASEIKGLIALGARVYELGPGQKLIWQNGKISIHEYFDPNNIKLERDPDFRDAADTLKELMCEAVRKRVATDLPVAVLLGGIDSAVVLSQAIKYHERVTAFTIGRDDQAEDVRFAKKLCSDLNVPLNVIHTSEDEVLALVPEIIRCIESFEPNHIRGGTLSYILSREVHRAGFRVALCGEGADELFGGYSEYGYHYMNHGYSSIRSMRLKFVSELHKTQLKRVDRTSMAFTLEVRVPFLDVSLAAHVLSLPMNFMIVEQAQRILGKYILREAFRNDLPEYAVNQEKRVLSDGAGFGTNDDEGPFYEHALNKVGEEEFREMTQKYPEIFLRNREEAWYFKLCERLYPVELCPFLHDRPFVNRKK